MQIRENCQHRLQLIFKRCGQRGIKVSPAARNFIYRFSLMDFSRRAIRQTAGLSNFDYGKIIKGLNGLEIALIDYASKLSIHFYGIIT